MEPMETALILSAVTDLFMRFGASKTGMTPEEYKKEVEAKQVTADELEKWLREGK